MERGDIYFVSLDPTMGHEQRGERPVVVISPKSFNDMMGVPIVVPVTSSGNFARVRGFAVDLAGAGLTVQGIVRRDQPRVLDVGARGARRTRERVPKRLMDEILARVGAIFEKIALPGRTERE